MFSEDMIIYDEIFTKTITKLFQFINKFSKVSRFQSSIQKSQALWKRKKTIPFIIAIRKLIRNKFNRRS